MTPLASWATCIFKECACLQLLFCLGKISNYVMDVFGFIQCITPSVWNLTRPAHPAQQEVLGGVHNKQVWEIPAAMAITARWNDPEARLKQCSQQFCHVMVLSWILCVFWLRIGSYFLPEAPKNCTAEQAMCLNCFCVDTQVKKTCSQRILSLRLHRLSCNNNSSHLCLLWCRNSHRN